MLHCWVSGTLGKQWYPLRTCSIYLDICINYWGPQVIRLKGDPGHQFAGEVATPTDSSSFSKCSITKMSLKITPQPVTTTPLWDIPTSDMKDDASAAPNENRLGSSIIE